MRKIPNKYKEDSKRSVFPTNIRKAKSGKLCFVPHYIYYQLKGFILTPWTEYVFNKSKKKLKFFQSCYLANMDEVLRNLFIFLFF